MIQLCMIRCCCVSDITAGELVSPDKTPQQVEEEAREGKDLYLTSHKSYEVGEQVTLMHQCNMHSISVQYINCEHV